MQSEVLIALLSLLGTLVGSAGRVSSVTGYSLFSPCLLELHNWYDWAGIDYDNTTNFWVN